MFEHHAYRHRLVTAHVHQHTNIHTRTECIQTTSTLHACGQGHAQERGHLLAPAHAALSALPCICVGVRM